MAMELLGPNLTQVLRHRPELFSLATVAEIGLQLLVILECIHSRGWVYRDVKPRNIVLDRRPHHRSVYLLDFGLMKKAEPEIPPNTEKCPTGTPKYMSIRTHAGYESSKRDDLEGMMYTLINLAKGSLPWATVEASSRKEYNTIVLQMKSDISPEELCQGLPDQYPLLMSYIRSLAHDEEPDYEMLKRMLRESVSPSSDPPFTDMEEPLITTGIAGKGIFSGSGEREDSANFLAFVLLRVYLGDKMLPLDLVPPEPHLSIVEERTAYIDGRTIVSFICQCSVPIFDDGSHDGQMFVPQSVLTDVARRVLKEAYRHFPVTSVFISDEKSCDDRVFKVKSNHGGGSGGWDALHEDDAFLYGPHILYELMMTTNYDNFSI